MFNRLITAFKVAYRTGIVAFKLYKPQYASMVDVADKSVRDGFQAIEDALEGNDEHSPS